MIKYTQPLPKVRVLQKNLQKQDQEAVTKLKATWLGHFYVNHIKKHMALHRLGQWIWRNGYPIWAKYTIVHIYKREARKWRILITLREFVKNRGIQTHKLIDAAFVETPKPMVFPTCDQSYLKSPQERYKFPEVFVSKITNGMIYGGTNLVLVEDEVICHDLYNFKQDYTSEELNCRTHIDPKKNRIRWLLNDENPLKLPSAAVFVDACASNYAHWLTEVLTRIAAFCSDEQFKDVPIIVNEGLHENIMRSLFLITKFEREIITLPIGRGVQIEELYLTSVAGYVPFERRNKKGLNHSHGLFHPKAFELIRNRIDACMEYLPDQQQAWPEKIFLRRNSGVRKVTNAAELENLLIDRGYAIVEPEKLTFVQQTQLFKHTKIIVGSSGAALANILFAPESAKIIILISKHANTSYWYWQNMACAGGKLVNYILGAPVAGSTAGIHADFTVNLKNVLQALGEE